MPNNYKLLWSVQIADIYRREIMLNLHGQTVKEQENSMPIGLKLLGTQFQFDNRLFNVLLSMNCGTLQVKVICHYKLP